MSKEKRNIATKLETESKYFIVAELLSACERMTFMPEGFLVPRLNLTPNVL